MLRVASASASALEATNKVTELLGVTLVLNKFSYQIAGSLSLCQRVRHLKFSSRTTWRDWSTFHHWVTVRVAVYLSSRRNLIKRQTISEVLSPEVARWFQMVNIVQFHTLYYISRPLPNTFALVIGTNRDLDEPFRR